MKYVVRNCPAITEYKFPDKVHKGCCQCTYGYCKDIDCVIKQVIEKCKDSKLSYSNLGILRTACETNQAYGKAVMAEQILPIFDIEEIIK